MKKTLIFSGILLIILACAAVFYFLNKNSDSNVAEKADLNSGADNSNQAAEAGNGVVVYQNSIETSETAGKITLGTTSGGIEVNDFLSKNMGVVEGGDILLADNSEYFITFNRYSGRFWIGITSSVFEEYRVKAEENLLKILGLSERDACKLSVVIGAPFRSGGSEATIAPDETGLSFCVK